MNPNGLPYNSRFDSIPHNETKFKLNLCFCPLCDKGKAAFDYPINVTWIYIARVIMFSLKRKFPKQDYFSLSVDVPAFVTDHWYLFQYLEQFRCQPYVWQKSLNEQFSNKDFFSFDEKLFSAKILSDNPPWEHDTDAVAEVSASSHIGDVEPAQNTENIQAELKESYLKTLQIANVAYLTCQKALDIYNDENSKANIMTQMQELQRVIDETKYLLNCFQK
ncbi:Uncharacterized protein QTN25_000301 [Entamoeba marina]